MKGFLRDPAELDEAALGKAPEGLDAIDMMGPTDELIVAMVDAKMLVEPHIHQAVVARPVIGIDDAGQFGMTSDNRLQRHLGAIRDDLGMHVLATLATDPGRSEVGFITFHRAGKRRHRLAMRIDAMAKFEINGVGRTDTDPTHSRGVRSSEIQGKTA